MEREISSEGTDILLTALSRIGQQMTEDDVTSALLVRDDVKNLHTAILHLLLESYLQFVEPRDEKRTILFKEVCKRLKPFKLMKQSSILDGLDTIRKGLAGRFFNFIKELCEESDPESTRLVLPRSFIYPHNTYNEHFDEIAEIAKGGFGIVCKAKHKVTDVIYAVKKIIFKYKSDEKYLKIVREARNIATLNHANIVSYNNAWIECFIPSEFEVYNSSSSSCSSDNEEICRSEEQIKYSSSSGCSIIFANTDLPASSNSSVHSHEVPSEDDFTKENDYKINSNFPNIRVMLCIQTEFCDCDLRLWLDKRSTGQELPFHLKSTDIFLNILKGVSYIHSKSIIHRDLKPNNIFYSKGPNVVKIGDFGLATLEKCSNENTSGCTSNSTDHTPDLGTPPYAAPEQRSKKSYDCKVDIYSLGIILIELLNNFSTRMEFMESIHSILNGTFPPEMVEKWPKLSDLVKNLLKSNPEDRIPVEKILGHFHEFDDKELEITRLKAIVLAQNKEIEALKAVISQNKLTHT